MKQIRVRSHLRKKPGSFQKTRVREHKRNVKGARANLMGAPRSESKLFQEIRKRKRELETKRTYTQLEVLFAEDYGPGVAPPADKHTLIHKILEAEYGRESMKMYYMYTTD